MGGGGRRMAVFVFQEQLQHVVAIDEIEERL